MLFLLVMLRLGCSYHFLDGLRFVMNLFLDWLSNWFRFMVGLNDNWDRLNMVLFDLSRDVFVLDLICSPAFTACLFIL